MALPKGTVTVSNPEGHTVTVNFTNKKTGATATGIFSNVGLTSAVTLPDKITATAKSYYFKEADELLISLKIAGQECATPGGTTATVTFGAGDGAVVLAVQPTGEVGHLPQAGAGIPIVAPNGTVYYITVSNVGALVVNTA